MTNPKYLILGEILRPHGVRGELRMRMMTDYPERITSLQSVYLGAGPDAPIAKRHTVEHMRMHQGYGLVTLEAITDRDQAETVRGLFVMVRIEDAVPLEEDEIYLYQLIGMIVRTDDGLELGKITDVLETGANDVYIVNGTERGEILIPAIDEAILETNVDNGIMTVKLPDGLL